MRNRWVSCLHNVLPLFLLSAFVICGLLLPAGAAAIKGNSVDTSAADPVIQTGSIRITIEPAAVVNAGAQWRYRLASESSWSAWLNSGNTASNLSAGEYYFEFQPISGWVAPHNYHVSLSAGESKSFVVEYSQEGGAMTVTIEPPEAAAAGAQWRLPDSPYLYWVNSGGSLSSIPAGNYTLEFKEIDGWDRPGSVQVGIASGQQVTYTGRYTQQTGSLSVTIQPSDAISQGAQWRRAGTSEWHNSGYTEAGVPVGNNCIIEVKQLPGWNYAQPESVIVRKNQTSWLTYSFTSPQGTFRVNIEPSAALNAGAQWRHRKMGETAWSEWHNPDYVITGLASCTMQVEFKELPGWIRPSYAQVEHYTDAADVVSGTYTMNMGSLLINIEPAGARSAGAFWKLVGKTDWLDSGRTIQYIPVGDWTIEFFEPQAWRSPGSITVQINRNETTTYTATFTEQRGSLLVNIQPQGAVTAGAKWRRVGTLTWLDGGQTETGVPAGEYTLEFKDIQAWRSPGQQTLTVNNNQTASYTATYVSTLPGGGLNVTLAPPEAVSAGAKWRYVSQDQSTTSSWFDSAQTATNVPAGQYSIEFAAIQNWDAPAGRTVSVSPGLTSYVNETYMQQRGSLSVDIGPKDAAYGGAAWRRVGTSTWRASGYVESSVLAQTYTIEFKPISGWVKPENQEVAVSANQAADLKVTYAKAVGSLTVTLTPIAAENSGGAWRRTAGPKPWRNSGQTEEGIAPGTYTVTFKDFPGFVRPDDVAVTITAGQNTSVTVAYTYITGSMRIMIQPQEAVSAGAGWRLKGFEGWNASGYTMADLPPGFHQIEFKEVTGWEKPADRSVEIIAFQTTTETAQYTGQAQSGSLKVMIAPPEAAAAGAKWRVAKTAKWYESGYTLGDIVNDSFTIEFKSIHGWDSPAGQNVTVKQDQNVSLTGTYVRQTGSLSVNIAPEEATKAGAKWRIAGSNEWHGSGDEIGYLGPIEYTIEFNSLDGWEKPKVIDLTVISGQVVRASGLYTRQTGALTVTLSPQEAVDARAAWRLKGTSMWRTSGYAEQNVSVGAQTIEFKEIRGWKKPSDENVSVEAGRTATFEQVYSPLPASITVTLSPSAAVDAGARWRIVGTGEWRESGYTDSSAQLGDRAVEFSDLAGWSKPADKSLNVKPGQAVKLSAAYTQLKGSLAVTIDPQQAVSAGARWKVKGTGQWRASGYTQENLNPGSYTVEFKTIQGWDKPTEIPIQVAGGQSAVTSGTYVVQKGSLTVVIGPQAAIDSGAKWRRKVMGLWRESGTREQQVEPGTFLVEFTEVQGWAKPDDKQVVIGPGKHTSLSVTYSPLTGALKVTIRPQGAINDGARWKLAGTDEWFESGHTIASLPAGRHTIRFKNVQGWIKPDDIEVTVSGGKTATTSGHYKKPGETRDEK